MSWLVSGVKASPADLLTRVGPVVLKGLVALESAFAGTVGLAYCALWFFFYGKSL
jgi:hypothetical protein